MRFFLFVLIALLSLLAFTSVAAAEAETSLGEDNTGGKEVLWESQAINRRQKRCARSPCPTWPWTTRRPTSERMKKDTTRPFDYSDVPFD